MLALLLLLPRAAALSYTVQVAALTDQAAARALLDDLRRQGFPAYLVGLPTEAGQVYRLRVGAFANRAAAVRYGESVETATGLTPVPALAEADMPILLLEPGLVAVYPYGPGVRAEVLRFPETLALRVQDSGEAEYRFLSPDAHARPVPAWRMLPLEDGGLLRVYSFPLWPPDYEGLSPEARRAEEEARLAAVAQSLGLGPAVLERYVIRQEAAPPVLVRAERWRADGSAERLPALGDPGFWDSGGEGPPLAWLNGEVPALPSARLPAPLVIVSGRLPGGEAEEGEPGWLQGEGWQARPDGDFTRLASGGRDWRALGGYPLWAGGDYLLTLSEGDLALYWLSPPP
ncbi:MAG: SPOR domain-containing protein [Deinococcota bacterium]|nr:SPOR domain-containing protein [Deinococcota bacterium]